MRNLLFVVIRLCVWEWIFFGLMSSMIVFCGSRLRNGFILLMRIGVSDFMFSMVILVVIFVSMFVMLGSSGMSDLVWVWMVLVSSILWYGGVYSLFLVILSECWLVIENQCIFLMVLF